MMIDNFLYFLLKKINPYKLINIGFLGCLASFLIVIFYHKSYSLLLIIYFCFGIFIAFVIAFSVGAILWKVAVDRWDMGRRMSQASREQYTVPRPEFPLAKSSLIGAVLSVYMIACVMES